MSKERWLGLVGIGEDGLDGLTPAARRLVAQAAFVVGGKRHLALAGPLKAETMTWPSPIENALDAIEAHRGRSVCVLASGDPFFFGVGAMLMRRFTADEMICDPGAVGLCARRVAARLEPTGLRIAHASRAAARGDHSASCTMARAFSRCRGTTRPRQAGGAADSARHGTIEAHHLRGDGRPARAHSHDGGARLRARQRRRSEHDRARGRRRSRRAHSAARGRAARRLVRARRADHQARDPRHDAVSARAADAANCLWDVGSGSGSVAIEWMLADPANKAVAIEVRHDRAERIARNALSFGVPGLSVVTGEAPQVFADLGDAGRDLHRRRGERAGHDRTRLRCAGGRADGWSSTR